MAGSKKILLIEDDVMIRELYKTTLVNSQFSVETAENSDEAYLKLKNFNPDVIFLDVMLPGLSGFDILKELRTNPVHGCQKTFIILLTNLAQRTVTDNAIESGADGYIIKSDILPTDLPKLILSLDD